MKPYFIVFQINELPGNGGGTFYHHADTIEDLDTIVNATLDQYGEKFKIIRCGEVRRDILYTPKEVVVKLERV